MRFTLPALLFVSAIPLLSAKSPYPEKTPDTPGNRMLDAYLASEARQLAQSGGLADVKDAEDWKAKAPEYRRQLAEMLGLDPMPERTPLNVVKTGEVKG
jgi:hypothetical protein